MNWFPEPVRAVGAPAPMILLPTPGQTAFATTTDLGTRGMFYTGSRQFTVVGTGLWETFANGAPISRGTVAQDSNQATISYLGLTGGQLFITSGTNGYTYVLATDTLTLVLTGEATMGGAKDGRFLAFNIANGKVRMSDLNDGLTWDATLYFQRSAQPDPWQAMVVTGDQISLIGEVSSEAWYNAGTFPQPFALIPGSSSAIGTKNPFSVKQAGDALVFLSNTAEGMGQVVVMKGYAAQPISTSAVDAAIARYDQAGMATDVETLVYLEAGHLFACVSFPTAKATWCVDLTTGQWHERGSWDAALHAYDVWHPRVSCHAFGKTLVGERATGVISEMAQSHGYEADGTLIRRLRIGPPIWAAVRRRLTVDLFTLFMDTGTANQNGSGSDPTVWLRESVNTRTFGSARGRSVGAIGDFSRTVSWSRCASSRKAWMPEIVVSDPIPWRIAGADVMVSGMAQAESAA